VVGVDFSSGSGGGGGASTSAGAPSSSGVVSASAGGGAIASTSASATAGVGGGSVGKVGASAGGPSVSGGSRGGMDQIQLTPSDIMIHRKTGGLGGEDVFRVVLEVALPFTCPIPISVPPSELTSTPSSSTESTQTLQQPQSTSPLMEWALAILSTPELRTEWDEMTEEASLVEIENGVGDDTNSSSSTKIQRVVRTRYRLGWPARYVFSPLPSERILIVYVIVREIR